LNAHDYQEPKVHLSKAVTNELTINMTSHSSISWWARADGFVTTTTV